MPDAYVLFLLALGIIVLLVAWLPLALRRIPLSLSILCVGLGAGVFALGWLDFDPDPRTYDTLVEKLCEAVVIISLMGAGLKLDRPIGLRAWATTWRMLGVAMPLTILGISVIAFYGLGFPVAMALLLGAALAPTDPVLASDVQVGKPRSGEDGEVRFALTSEAGLNDGLAFPFVHLALAFAAAAAASQAWPDMAQLSGWLLIDVAWRIFAGIGVGWLVGRVLGKLTFGVSRVKLSGTGDGLVAIGATLVAYAITEVFHGYGFLAVFVSALVLRDTERNHEYHEALHDFAEQIERLLMMLVLVLFGGAIATGLFASLTWIDGVVAIAIVFLIRPFAGWISLLGSRLPGRERSLIAFFGIRGIGSFYYVAYGINHGSFGSSDRLWAITGLVVLLSVIVHGISATPLMRWMDRSRAKDQNLGPVRRSCLRPCWSRLCRPGGDDRAPGLGWGCRNFASPTNPI
ncbi:MAG: cation:proton antiporter [Hyphomonadaceae bacterium]|nr:cation:proton antiporter [Hyphomonadaceae bacterium]